MGSVEKTMNVLETERLFIRPYQAEDVDLLYAILSDPVTMSYWPAPFVREQVKAWISRNQASYREHGYGRWALIEKGEGRLIGDAGIVQAEIDQKLEFDLGYIIAAPHWRKGYAFEAVQACLNYGLTHLKLPRVVANMAFNHEGSRKVAEKIGMVYEKQFLNRRNRDIVTLLYSVESEK